jgi:hypothetical protein
MNTDVDKLIEYVVITIMKGKYKGIAQVFEEYKMKDSNKLLRILLKENNMSRGEIMRKFTLSKIEDEIDRLIRKVKEINDLVSEKECLQLKNNKKIGKSIQKDIDENKAEKSELIDQIDELKKEREALLSIED